MSSSHPDAAGDKHTSPAAAALRILATLVIAALGALACVALNTPLLFTTKLIACQCPGVLRIAPVSIFLTSPPTLNEC